MAAKQSKSAVRYGEGGDHCGVCVHFIEPEGEDDDVGSCELVEGEIREDMWCKLFKREKRTLADEGYR